MIIRHVGLQLRVQQLPEIWHTFCRTFCISADHIFNWNAGISIRVGFITWLIRIWQTAFRSI